MIGPTQFDLDAYLDELALPDAGRETVEYIMTEEPGRLVRSSPRNSSGRYWSRKCGWGIQFESRTLEYPYIIELEFDPDVRRYADQPAIKVTFVHADPDGTKFTITLQPDFAVLRASRVEIVDVMREDELVEKSRQHPGLYILDEAGIWHCSGMESWAAERGLVHRIVVERDLPKTRIRNHLSLSEAAFAASPSEVVLAALDERVSVEPGVVLEQLRREGVDVNVAKWALAHGRVVSDLDRHLVDDPDHFPLYPSVEVMRLLDPSRPASWAVGREAPETLPIEPGVRFLWGDTEGEILAVASDRVWVKAGHVASTELVRSAFEDMWRSTAIRAVPPPAGALHEVARDVALERYRAGGRRGLQLALEHAEIIAAFVERRDNPDDTAWSRDKQGRLRFLGWRPETIEEWIRERRRVAAATGDNLAGLVPRRNPGNRHSKLDPRVEALIVEVARDLYATLDRRVIPSVILEVRRRAEDKKLPPPNARTVRARLKRLPIYETARARLGDSGAYRLEPHVPVDPDAPPPNGTCAGEVLFIDHTVVDDETIDPESGDDLGRLTLSCAVDGFVGKEPTHRFFYGAPNGTTVCSLLIDYFEKTGIVPGTVVLDLDPSHKALELLALQEATRFTILWHRTRKARDGWRVERRFGTANDEFFHALKGNTQVMREVRQVTSENNPKRRTVWDLVRLDALYTEYRDRRNNRFDPLLGMSPNEAWDLSLLRAGRGRLIRVDERVRFLGMPYADGVTRVIHPKDGVVVGYLRYESREFEDPEVAGREAEIRLDPDDASRVVALIDGRAIVARCPAIARLRVCSRVELALLSQIIRRNQTSGRRLQATFERELAKLLADARDWERIVEALQANATRANKAAQRPPDTGAAGEREPDVPVADALTSYWERRAFEARAELEKAG